MFSIIETAQFAVGKAPSTTRTAKSTANTAPTTTETAQFAEGKLCLLQAIQSTTKKLKLCEKSSIYFRNTLQKIPFWNIQNREIYTICTGFLHV